MEMIAGPSKIGFCRNTYSNPLKEDTWYAVEPFQMSVDNWPMYIGTNLNTQFITYREKLKRKAPPFDTFIALDPGETTGAAIFRAGNLASYGQIRSTPSKLLRICLYLGIPIVCEDYRIYQHKLQQHNMSPVETLRRIGEIEAAAAISCVPLVMQMAIQVKPFWTDDRLEKVGLKLAGKKHAQDAIRHGAYFLTKG